MYESNGASGGEEEFVVEKICDVRVRGGVREYYLKWKGFSELVYLILWNYLF